MECTKEAGLLRGEEASTLADKSAMHVQRDSKPQVGIVNLKS